MLYLTCTFSPQMLRKGSSATIEEIELEQAIWELNQEDFKSAVRKESSAAVLSALLKRYVPHGRVSLQLEPGDNVIVIMSSFNPGSSEFSREDVLSMPVRVFKVQVY
ncbi:MAG: DUF1874 domain-containing protein [Chloroherpetonaceae bacterium]|nr:DUF1874 domain-containing protein [Chloroherpetonaceae bacterium]